MQRLGRTIVSDAIAGCSLVYNPIATLPGLRRQRHHAVPRLRATYRRPFGARRPAAHVVSTGLSEVSEFLITNALIRASLWADAGHWPRPDISVRLDSAEVGANSSVAEVVQRGLRLSRIMPRCVTIELACRPGCRLDIAEPNLRRLKDLGVRLSYDRGIAPVDFDTSTFDEVRADFGATATGPAAREFGRIAEDAIAHRQSVLARGVTTGGRLMAAFALGATHIQGELAGAPYSDAPAYRLTQLAADDPVGRRSIR